MLLNEKSKNTTYLRPRGVVFSKKLCINKKYVGNLTFGESSSEEEEVEDQEDEENALNERQNRLFTKVQSQNGRLDVGETVEEFDVDAARKWINSNRTPEEKKQNVIDRAAYYKYKKNIKSKRKGRRRKYQKPFNFLKELILQLQL